MVIGTSVSILSPCAPPFLSQHISVVLLSVWLLIAIEVRPSESGIHLPELPSRFSSRRGGERGKLACAWIRRRACFLCASEDRRSGVDEIFFVSCHWSWSEVWFLCLKRSVSGNRGNSLRLGQERTTLHDSKGLNRRFRAPLRGDGN